MTWGTKDYLTRMMLADPLTDHVPTGQIETADEAAADACLQQGEHPSADRKDRTLEEEENGMCLGRETTPALAELLSHHVPLPAQLVRTLLSLEC
jgi:hypothetical protein